MKPKFIILLVMALLLIGCSDNQTSPEASGLSLQLEQANKDIANLKSENEKLKTESQPSTTAENQSSQSKPTDDFKEAEVVRIVDGDTIEIMVDGNKDTVRLLLVDTPETKDPNEPVQPYGPEATEFAENLLLDNPLVRIEMDGPERDKYDRLLAYIWVGDKLFNEALIESGLARVAYVYEPPYKHYDQLLAAEKKAKESGIGIWSIDGYASADGFNEEFAMASSSPSVESSEEPTEEVYYANCAAVRAAGAAPIHEGDPGYSTKLDRDRDGIGCE